MRRIPLNVFQKAIYERLSSCQDVPVYDHVPQASTKLPYITFGSFTSKNSGSKVDDISDVTINIDIWSAQKGRKQVNEIANDIIMVLQAAPLELADGFRFMGGEVDFFEAFQDDEYGYHGVITFLAKIQNRE